MKITDFLNISIRGRIAYVILCFENYVKVKYPNTNMQTVLEMMWHIVDDSDTIDNSAYKYMEIIPEYLYEFDSYDKLEFEYLSRDQYVQFTRIIPKPEENPDVDIIMHSIYDISMEYAYTIIEKQGRGSLVYITKVLEIMKKEGLALPEYEKISKFSFDEYNGWGDFINPNSLSTML